MGTILKVRLSYYKTLRCWVSISGNSKSFVLLSRTQEYQYSIETLQRPSQSRDLSWQHSWLRPCATSWKVAGSIPDWVIDAYHLRFPTGQTMALGASASNRNENQEYLVGLKGGRCLRLTTLLPSLAVCLEIWESQESRSCQHPSKPVRGLLYLLLTFKRRIKSHLRFAGIIRSSPYSPRFQGKG